MIRRIVAALWLFVTTVGPAAAQTCSFGISDINFGSVNLITGAAVDMTGTINISCSGLLLTTVRICPNIGAGSGGATSLSRQMTGAGGTLNYQLYSNAGRTTVWGSYNWGFPDTPPTIDLPLGLGGAASTTRTIFARVLAGQTSAPATSYTSIFTAADTQFSYGVLGVLPCPNILIAQTANPTFTVTALGANNCAVSAVNINFGAQGVLTANIDAAGQLSVTCTNSTVYSIGLNNGITGSAPTTRLMTNGANTITYGLYQNAARTIAWGGTIGTNTVAGTGTGLAQLTAVYGRVPAQITPSPGIYTDTIIVTVTY